MKFRYLLSRVGVPLLAAALLALAYRWYGWAGAVVVATALVMWALLHFNRVMHILKRAASRPIGYVDSAVMLNAKLRVGVTLLHVVALTRSLGEQNSAPQQQPEMFCWTDASGSQVRCEFAQGRLVKWDLVRSVS